MPRYRYRGATGSADELIVIEDKGMFVKDKDGSWTPGYKFIDSCTVKAHPFIIDILLLDSERLWTLEELLRMTTDGE